MASLDEPWPSPSGGERDGIPDPWQNEAVAVPRGGPAFAEMLRAMRDLQDTVAGTNPPPELVALTRDRLDELVELLRPWAADEATAPAGKRPDLPGRGNTVLPPFVVDEETPGRLRGRVRFTRFYLGGNGAAHGGTLPLLFDDLLGRLCNAAGRARARTAYLTVNYRRVTPIGPELQFEATVDAEEGRKRFISGRLLHHGEVLADAQGLFVVLLPGQP